MAASASSAVVQTKEQIDEQMASYPVIDLANYLSQTGDFQSQCDEIARLLYQFGLLIVKDPRVDDKLNTNFLNMMENYYDQETKVREADARPEVHYQVGVTPEGIEKARNHCERVKGLNSAERPLTECPPEHDLKSRYFWRIGPAPASNANRDLNMPQVVPAAFPQWTETMDAWGEKILGALKTVSEMAAIGFKLPADTFTSKMNCAPHLLAPTGSDLKKHGNRCCLR